MPGVLPFLPLIAGAVGMISANGQNKSNQKNADNAAASARTNDGAALQQALSQYQGYTQSHPSPYANAAPIMGPQSTYGQSSPHMGGQTLGANGMPEPGAAPQAPPQGQGSAPQSASQSQGALAPSISSLVQALLGQQQAAMQPPSPSANTGSISFDGGQTAPTNQHYQIGPNGPGRQRLMDGLFNG